AEQDPSAAGPSLPVPHGRLTAGRVVLQDVRPPVHEVRPAIDVRPVAVARRQADVLERQLDEVVFLAVARLLSGVAQVHARILHLVRHQRSEEHTSELQSRGHLVCRLLLEKKKKKKKKNITY